MLILLYYLSQNPSFADGLKPILSQLNDSKKMFDFLKDLSQFQDLFSLFNGKTDEKKEEKKEAPREPPKEKEKEQEKKQSPTKGIANEFIEQKLEEYFSRR